MRFNFYKKIYHIVVSYHVSWVFNKHDFSYFILIFYYFLKFHLVFWQRRNNYNQGRRRLSGRAFRAQREDSIRRTVYVSDIDQHVSANGRIVIHLLLLLCWILENLFLVLEWCCNNAILCLQIRSLRSGLLPYLVAVDK